MDKKPAKMESISFMKAVNLWMTFSLLALQNFYIILFLKEYIIFQYVFQVT